MIRVLLIARHFPPLVSGGARRSLAIRDGLTQAGIRVDIVAPCLSGGMEGLTVPHPHPDPSPREGDRQGLRDRLRPWLFWPDPDIRWSKRAARAAAKMLPAPDVVITTSPPESIHAAGRMIQKRTNAIWIADFRDSWLDEPLAPWRTTRLRRLCERAWARHVLRRADALTVVDERSRGEVQGLLDACHQVTILEQPADPPTEREAFCSSTRNIVHTGSFRLSDPDRDIATALQAFESAFRSRTDLRLHLVGRLTNQERNKVAASSAANAIVLHDTVDLHTVRRMQAGADLGLIVAAPDTNAVPGKLFEYAAAGLPVAILGGGAWAKTFSRDNADAVAIMTGASEPIRLPPPLTVEEFGVALATLIEDTRRRRSRR